MNRFSHYDANFAPVAGGTPEHAFTADHLLGITVAVDFLGGKAVTADKADKLLAACRLGGFDDWRGPDVMEEVGQRDYARQDPAMDPVNYPRSPSYGWVWTRTPAAWSVDEDTKAASAAWSVSLHNGDANTVNRNNNGFVRAVRSGVPSSQ